MAQEFRQPEDNSTSPRAQRMTADESRAVIALWQQERVEQTGLTDKPAVPDVAEGLEVTVEDVQRLLAEVRAQRQEEERTLAAEQERALTERRLAEEKADLAEARRQRAELHREQARRQGQVVPRSQWVETKLGVWEDAGLPGYSYVDFNRLAPNQDGVDQIVQPLAVRFAAALAKVILLSLTLGLFVIAPLLYVLWCLLTGPH